MRKLAYTYGKQLRPDQTAFSTLHEALDLNGFKGTCKSDLTSATEEQVASALDPRLTPLEPLVTPKTGVLFVAVDGSDAADGSITAPMQSLQLACDKVAADPSLDTVVLREGAFLNTKMKILRWKLKILQEKMKILRWKMKILQEKMKILRLKMMLCVAGTHYLADTLYLTADHSGLTIQSRECCKNQDSSLENDDSSVENDDFSVENMNYERTLCLTWWI